jgi:peptide deformylase
MIYRVVKYGDPVLETPAEPWSEFDTAELRQLVADMFETMYAHKGIGLAAPQIAVSRRLTVIDVSAGEDPSQQIVLLNPEVIHKEGVQIGEEGCLSIPGFRENVKRAMKVRVRAQDVKGNFFEIEGEELLARAMQHEIDHLNGILFLSHLSALKRDLIKRKIRKLQKAGEWN